MTGAVTETPSVTIKQLTEKRKDGTLVGFRCANGHTWVSPTKRCSKCGQGVKPVDLPKEGTVISFTIQNVAAEEFINETPFAWAIVELSDGARVTGWVPYVASDKDLAIGDAVVFTPTYKPGIMFEKA